MALLSFWQDTLHCVTFSKVDEGFMQDGEKHEYENARVG